MGSGQAKMLITMRDNVKHWLDIGPISMFLVPKKADIIITHGKSKETLHCRTHLAHYASMPQEGIPAKIF